MTDHLLITRKEDKLVTAWEEQGRICRLQVDSLHDGGLLGNIYVGKVRNIVKNLGAAFVEFEKGQMGYLPLQTAVRPIPTDSVIHGQERVLIGDEILVQVEREAVKTKPPTLTGALELPGKYVVLTYGKKGSGISRRIRDKEVRTRLLELLNRHNEAEEFGLLARTNSADASVEEIEAEIKRLSERFHEIVSCGRHRAQFSCLHHAPPAYLESVQGLYRDAVRAVITDDEEVYEMLLKALGESGQKGVPEISLWNPEHGKLDAIYNISRTLEKALQPKVWLRNGGYLVIQPTEALVSVDVNTGKAISKKKDIEKSFLKVNLEAARELALQLRLRNLSGIILVDFIDMQSEEANRLLMDTLRAELGRDVVQTRLVDMTKLGLVEITRKKVRRPLHEQVAQE